MSSAIQSASRIQRHVWQHSAWPCQWQFYQNGVNWICCFWIVRLVVQLFDASSTQGYIRLVISCQFCLSSSPRCTNISPLKRASVRHMSAGDPSSMACYTLRLFTSQFGFLVTRACIYLLCKWYSSCRLAFESNLLFEPLFMVDFAAVTFRVRAVPGVFPRLAMFCYVAF